MPSFMDMWHVRLPKAPHSEESTFILMACHHFEILNNVIFELVFYKWDPVGQWRVHMSRGDTCDMCVFGPCWPRSNMTWVMPTIYVFHKMLIMCSDPRNLLKGPPCKHQFNSLLFLFWTFNWFYEWCAICVPPVPCHPSAHAYSVCSVLGAQIPPRCVGFKQDSKLGQGKHVMSVSE